jgi:hypothetical protein
MRERFGAAAVSRLEESAGQGMGQRPSQRRGYAMRTRGFIKSIFVGLLAGALIAGPASLAFAEPGTQSALSASQGQGSGHVKVEPTSQDQGTLANQVTVDVRGMTPNATFSVQRAIDHTPGDGVCTIDQSPPNGWVTDATITTSQGGAGAAHYSVHRSNVSSGTQIDIIFRVIGNGTALRSDCMTFTAK